MPTISNLILGLPGVRAAVAAIPKRVFNCVDRGYLPGGKFINGTLTRDTSNTYTDRLQGGLLMGKVTASGFYANSVIDQNTVAYDGSTTFTVSAAGAVELVRRVGSTGTFTVTGPPAAAGVVKQATLTYSAANTSTGAITVTAASVNAVQTLGFTNSPSGTFALRVVDLNGVVRDTPQITYSATIGTLLSNIQTALTAAVGAATIVPGGTLVTAVSLTYSEIGRAHV